VSAEALQQAGAAAADPPAARPAWLLEPAPPDMLPARALTPSNADDESSAAGATDPGAGAERIKALARGVLMHRLLQALPGIAPERRAEAARRHVARASPPFTSAEREAMIEQIRRVLEDPRFADLFGPVSRAEVPIVGRIVQAGRTIPVSGQVDRLAITAQGVLIADYKTNRPPPRRPEDVPAGYLRQLALYRAVLGRVYPDRPVRAALVWTEVPDLMEISAPTLERALATLTSP
jgi:ATP-dependent helicase/nuclease subunit A